MLSAIASIVSTVTIFLEKIFAFRSALNNPTTFFHRGHLSGEVQNLAAQRDRLAKKQKTLLLHFFLLHALTLNSSDFKRSQIYSPTVPASVTHKLEFLSDAYERSYRQERHAQTAFGQFVPPRENLE